VAKKGKILGNLEELETTNLVDIFNAGEYFVAPPRPLRPVWGEEDMLEKKGYPRRPGIPIRMELTLLTKPYVIWEQVSTLCLR
jgi:hypothetical protein